MTEQQLSKAKAIAESIGYLSESIRDLRNYENGEFYHFNCSDYQIRKSCLIAKNEVIAIFEKKLKELQDELAGL